MHLPHDPGPHWGEVGIHGLHRQREWDAVVTLERSAAGSDAWFVVLADGHVVEAELHMKGPNLFGREASSTYEAATDLLVDKLERQVERLRDKKVREPRRRAQGSTPEPMPVEEIEQGLRPTNG